MRRRLGVVGSFGFVLVLGSCQAATVGSDIKVPPDAADTCETHCRAIGLRLTAVAIMASNVGCVCQQAGEKSAAPGGEASAAGMATIMLQQQAQRQHENQQAAIPKH
jgi:hypothetical protein